MTNPFTDLQAEAARRLSAEEWLASAPAVRVIPENHGDLANEIERSLKGAGITVVVGTPMLSGADESTRALDVSMVIAIGEATRINRGPTGTKKAGYDVAIACLGVLWRQTLAPGFTPLEFVELTQDFEPGDNSDMMSWLLRFRARVRLRVEPEEIT